MRLESTSSYKQGTTRTAGSPPGTGVTSGAQVLPDAAQLGSFGSASGARYQCTCKVGERSNSVKRRVRVRAHACAPRDIEMYAGQSLSPELVAWG